MILDLDHDIASLQAMFCFAVTSHILESMDEELLDAVSPTHLVAQCLSKWEVLCQDCFRGLARWAVHQSRQAMEGGRRC